MISPPRIPEVELSARIAQAHPLLERAEPCLDELAELLEPGPYGLALVDRDGIALWARSRGLGLEVSPGTACGSLLGAQDGGRPALLARGEPFRLESGGMDLLGHPATVSGMDASGALVLCEPAGAAAGREPLLRLAARAIGLAQAPAAAPGALERHRRWLEEIVRQVPAALAVADARTGRIVMASRWAEDRFGGPLLGQEVVDVVTGARFAPRHADGRPLARAEYPLVRALESGQPISDEELILTVAGGREVTVLLSIAPILEDGRPGALVITLEDVTERRAAERERERMIAALGHDLRQPLSAVLLALDALESDGALVEHRAILRKTRRSAGRIEAMIRDLLDFGASAAGAPLQVQPQEADLRGIAESVVEELQVVDPGLEVDLRVAGDVRGSWDEGRLEQVLTNLLTNAARYGEPRAPVEVRLSGEGAEVAVEVRNRGEPIPAGVQERLFQPFVRGSRKGPGLGLGLYIVREIARAHGGSVAVRSGGEEGTVFAVRLPRRCQAG